MSVCVICQAGKAKFDSMCLCQTAKLHKKCMVELAVQCYKRKSRQCRSCGSIFGCLKPHHFSQATRTVLLRGRLLGTSFNLGKAGIVPTYYSKEGTQVSQETKKRKNEEWESVIDKEIEDAPFFVQDQLKRAKKREVKFGYFGSKWD